MPDKEKLGAWWDIASARGLLVVAVAAVVFDALHKLGLVSWVNPEDIIILLVAFLCVGLASERVLVLRRIWDSIGEAREKREELLNEVKSIATTLKETKTEVTQDLQDVEETDQAILRSVTEMSTLEKLIGKDAIEQAATKIIRASSNSDEIIATSQYSSHDSLSDDYINVMAERVERAVSDKGEMEVLVVMSAKTGTEDKVEDRRTHIFRERGIDDRLNTRRAKHGWPLEVLIVGNAMIIALRRGGKRATYEVAIKIEDQEFVGRASKWFREEVWGEADQDD